jgi:hypothetical protein
MFYQLSQNKKQAPVYLAQAIALLPKISVQETDELNPYRKLGTISLSELIGIYTRVAHVQSLLGQNSVARATLLKAQLLALEDSEKGKKDIIEGQNVGTLIDGMLENKFLPEALALYKKYDTYGTYTVALAKAQATQNPALAQQTFLMGLAKIAKNEDEEERFEPYLAIIESATQLKFSDINSKALAAATSLVPELLLGSESDAVLLCRGISLGVKADKGKAKNHLAERCRNSQREWAIGLSYLGEEEEAKNVLDGADRVSAQLIAITGVEAFMARAKRLNDVTEIEIALLDTTLPLKDTERISLLQLAEGLAGKDSPLYSGRYREVLKIVSPKYKDELFTKMRVSLRHEALEIDKADQKSPINANKKRDREQSYVDIVENAAVADKNIALKYLAKITLPCYKVPALLALAEIEFLTTK